MPRGFNPSRRSYPLPIAVSNSISNTPQGGGNKLQGLPPSIDIPSNLNRPCCLNKAWNPPEERTKIVCMNTLSGVGRGRSQFNPSADGINCLVEDCCEQYIKSLYQDPNFRSCLDLTAIYLPLPSLEYTASQCVVDLFVSWGGPVMWVLPQGFRYTGTNVLSTRTSPTGHWGNFNFLLTQLPDILQIWAPDYYAALPNYANASGDPCTTVCHSCADYGGQGSTPCTDLIIAAINRYHKTYPNQFYLDNITGMQQPNGLAEVQNHGGDAVFPHSTPKYPQWWFYSGVGTGVFTSMGHKNLIALNKFHAIKIAKEAGFQFKLDKGGTAMLPTPKQMLEKAKFFYSQFISDIGDSNVASGPPSAAGQAFIDYLNPYWNNLSRVASSTSPDYEGWALSLCGALNQTDYKNNVVKIGTAAYPITDPRAFWSLFTAGTFTDGGPVVWEVPSGGTIGGNTTFKIDTLLNYLTIDSFSESGPAYNMIQMLSQPNKQGGFCVEMLTSRDPTFYRYNNGAYVPCPNLNNKVQNALPWDCLFCAGVGPSQVTCPHPIF